MSKFLLLCATVQLITISSLYSMEKRVHPLPLRYDDYATHATERHPLLQQDKNRTWQTHLSLDLAKAIAGYLPVDDKKSVRLVCKTWLKLFRHPSQSYGNGHHCPVIAKRKTHWLFGHYTETTEQCLDRLVKRIENRPQAQQTDSIELKLCDYHNNTTHNAQIIAPLFETLHQHNLTGIIKKITFQNIDVIPENIGLFSKLVSLNGHIYNQTAAEGYALSAKCPQLQELDVEFKAGGILTGQDIINHSFIMLGRLIDLPKLQYLHIDSFSVQFNAESFFLLLDLTNLKELDAGVICLSSQNDAELYNCGKEYFTRDHNTSILKSLKLNNMRLEGPFSSFFLERLCFHAPNLEELELEGFGEGVGEGLQYLASLHNLKKLTFRDTHGLSPIKQLFHTGLHITSLAISQFNLPEQLSTEENPLLPCEQLEELELSFAYATSISTEALGKIFSLCPQLKKLSIHLSHAQPSAQFIELLASIPELQAVSIGCYPELSRTSKQLLAKFTAQHKSIKVTTR